MNDREELANMLDLCPPENSCALDDGRIDRVLAWHTAKLNEARKPLHCYVCDGPMSAVCSTHYAYMKGAQLQGDNQMPENTRSTNHTYNEGRYSGVPGSGRSQTENTRSSELDKILAEHWSDLRVVESGNPGTRSNAHKKAKRRIEALIASKVEEARENAFAGGFGAGGGELEKLELAWNLYNEALQSKEEEL